VPKILANHFETKKWRDQITYPLGAPVPDLIRVRPGGRIQEDPYGERRTIMTFHPLHDRILVRRTEAEEKSAGGIIIPDTAQEKPMEGEVVAVGPGARDEAGKLVPLDVKVGDRILFGKWSGTEIKLDGEDLLIMKEGDVLGILDTPRAVKQAA
jgi:chaperonin GroES